MIFRTSIILFLLLAVACTAPHKDKEATAETENPSAQSYTEQYFQENILGKNKLLNGKIERVYPNGIKAVVNYVDGEKHGKAANYFKDGSLYKERQYVKGKLHGPFADYDSKGRLSRDGRYLFGNLDGTYKRYFKSGNPKLIIQYRNGLPMPGHILKGYQGNIEENPIILISDMHLSDHSTVYKLHLSDESKVEKAYVLNRSASWEKGDFNEEQCRLDMIDSKCARYEASHKHDDRVAFYLLYKLKSGELVCAKRTFQ